MTWMLTREADIERKEADKKAVPFHGRRFVRAL